MASMQRALEERKAVLMERLVHLRNHQLLHFCERPNVEEQAILRELSEIDLYSRPYDMSEVKR